MNLINYQLSNNKLSIRIIGKIDTTNTDNLNNQINNIINNNEFEKIILDFEEVSYISSVGLRMILNLKKNYDLSIINVSLEVYDIFEVTGFSKIINIRKRLREVSIEGCEKIGEGATGIVYQLTPDQIIKVFKYDYDYETIEKEIEVSRKAFVLGVPTAIAFDVVKVNGKYGLVFELLHSHSVGKQLVNGKITIDEFIPIYAELFKELHSIEAPDGYFPKVIDHYLQKLDDYTAQYLTKEEYDKLKHLMISIKKQNYLVHGDCHIKNIMLSEDQKPILIDLETLSVGAKVFDYAGIYTCYILFQEADENDCLKFFGLDAGTLKHLFYGMLSIVFNGEVIQEVIDKITIIAAVLLISYVYMYEEGKNELRISQAVNHIKELLPKYDNLDLD